MPDLMKYVLAAGVAAALMGGGIAGALSSKPATAAGGEARILQRIDARLAQMNQRLGAIRDSLKDSDTNVTVGDALASRGVSRATTGATGIADLLAKICRHTSSSPGVTC